MRARWCLPLFVLAVACGAAEPLPPVPDPPPAPASWPEWISGDPVGGESTRVVALAGTWRIGAEDGGRYLRADGAAWVPGTPPANLPMKAALLFPRSAGAFASRVMMGLQFPTAVVADLGTFGDGELAVDFRLIGGETDQYAGLLFGMTDDANHLAFRYNTKDGDAALWRVVDGERERIHHGGIPVTVPLGEWSTLRVRVEGPVLTGWVGDTLALEYTLPSAPAGLVGLWNKADSITDYRNLRVPLSLPGSRARP